MPQVYTPRPAKESFEVGLIVHYVHNHYFEIVQDFLLEQGIKLINIERYLKLKNTGEVVKHNIEIAPDNIDGSELEQFVDEVCSCKKIYSTSLHGLIIPLAYDIPAQWLRFESSLIRNDDDCFKFFDFFSGINQEDYAKPLNLPKIDLNLILGLKEHKIEKLPSIKQEIITRLRSSYPY